MGLIPDDASVRNGEFNWEPDWNYGAGWSRSPNYAQLITTGAGFEYLSQTGIQTEIGVTYQLTFKITFQNIAVINFGLIVDLSGDTDGLKYNNPGTYVATIVSTQENSTLRFHHDWVNAGLIVRIDSIQISSQLNFPANALGFDWPDDRRTELFNFGGGRFNQILASRNGKTNCLMAYDV